MKKLLLTLAIGVISGAVSAFADTTPAETVTIQVNRQNFRCSRTNNYSSTDNFPWGWTLFNTGYQDLAHLRLCYDGNNDNNLNLICLNGHSGNCGTSDNNREDLASHFVHLTPQGKSDERTYTNVILNSESLYYISGYSFKAVPKATGYTFTVDGERVDLPTEGKEYSKDNLTPADNGFTFKATFPGTSTDNNIELQNFTITLKKIPGNTVTYTVKVGDNTIATLTELVAAGTAYSTPAVPGGVTLSEKIENAVLTGDKNITVSIDAANEHLFKLVSARERRRWAKFNDIGLTTVESTENTTDAYSTADWLLEVPTATDGKFNIYAPSQLKYLGEIADSGNPTALAESTGTPGVFTITRRTEAIGNITPYWASEQIASSNGNAFNLRGGNVAGWSGTDIGSQWFMVYDYNTFVANREYFCASDASQGNDNNVGQISTKVAEAKALYDELLAGGTTADELAALLAVINNVYTLRLGKKGVSAEAYLVSIAAEIAKLDTSEHDFLAIKELGDPIHDAAASLPAAIVNDAVVTAWVNASAAKDSYTAADVTTITTAYNNLLKMVKDDSHVLFRHSTEANDYIAVDNDLAWYRGNQHNGKRAFTLKAATDGGFYLYNEYSNQYMKFYNENNNNQHAVATAAAASRFIFDAGTNGRVGIKCIDEGNYTMRHLHSNGTNTILRWGAGEKSSWFVELCDGNQAASEYLQGAKDSRHLSLVSPLTGFYSISDTEVMAEFNRICALDEATTQNKRDKGAEIYTLDPISNDVLTLNMPTTGKLYTIRCTDVANNRGNLQYKAGYDAIMTSGCNGVDYSANDVNQQWAVYVDTDKAVYLYNLGANKFANIYFDRVVVEPNYASGNTAKQEAHCWQFSEVPTAITEFVTEGLNYDATEGHGFKIYAAEGKNTTPGYHAGMFIINGMTNCPVPASVAFGSDDNGIGFWFTEVGTVTPELQAKMKALCDAYPTVVAEAKTAFDGAAAAEANEDLVGHYTSEGITSYNNAKTAATVAGAEPDTQYFHYIRGLNAERVGLEHESVYTLRTSEDMHYAVIDGLLKYTSDDAKVEDEKTQVLANTHYWKANVDGNEVYFTHSYTTAVEKDKDGNVVKPEETHEIELEHAGATRFNITFGRPGVVVLTPAPANEPSEAPAIRKVESEDNTEPITFTITKAPADAKATTTSISEIESWSERSEAIYDLQGRRLAAPVKGINIIGGRKVLVK